MSKVIKIGAMSDTVCGTGCAGACDQGRSACEFGDDWALTSEFDRRVADGSVTVNRIPVPARSDWVKLTDEEIASLQDYVEEPRWLYPLICIGSMLCAIVFAAAKIAEAMP